MNRHLSSMITGYTMPSWTPDNSMILSLLLDLVVGTQKAINYRQDYCRIRDSFTSLHGQNIYFTGSKAEGLELPGSDEDYMFDMNNLDNIRVTQLLDENSFCFLLMSTENTPPGFVLLKHDSYLPPFQIYLNNSFRNINGSWYLSSDWFINNKLLAKLRDEKYLFMCILLNKIQRQGPSMEISGVDHVPSIHCAFWPNEASEWVHRPRYFNWPTPQDISSIYDFGFHLVPVGHPQSDMKMMEWRISFSVAERTLVWSFNHVQMKCYAVMKIILKEFIQVKCNPQNQILCSYFIKTFLFWKYETTSLTFWRTDNLRNCINYLLSEFSKCIQEGVLMHYFIPKFNLLSIKLTRAAQRELLQLFDIIIQSDISILKECRTLKNVWSEFLQVLAHQDRTSFLLSLKIRNLLRNDECAMRIMMMLDGPILNKCRNITLGSSSSEFVRILLSSCIAPFIEMTEISQALVKLFCKTPVKTLALKICLFEKHLDSVKQTPNDPGNRGVYQLCRIAKNDTYSFDLSTSKLWCAILSYTKGSILLTLDIVNNVLSNIPPFAMYFNYHYNEICASNEAKTLYANMFLDSDIPILQKAKKAWMLDLCIMHGAIKDRFPFTPITIPLFDLPLAIKIEYSFHRKLFLSPFTCAYYLQFLCYHEMNKYHDRDRSLQALIDIVNDLEEKQNCKPYISLNITGHCLLLVGRRDEARDMFYRSYACTQQSPFHSFNSATWYLQICLYLQW